MAISIDKEKQITELRAKGKSFAAIATEAMVSKQTAVDVSRRNKERIASLRALELDALYEEQHITITERIKAHANLMKRIREEIENRDLSNVPTDKLIELFIKEAAALREEIIQPDFKSREEQQRDKEEREYLENLTASE